MRFERTTDPELIRRVITHPRVWPNLADDFAPARENFEPDLYDGIWCVAAYDAGELLGLFKFYPLSHVLWEEHVAFLPSAWGPRALAAAQAAPAWLFARTLCRRIVASIPETNQLSIRFARRIGMTQYGVNPRSCLIGGELRDQHLFGLDRE